MPAEGGALEASGVVATMEARAMLIAEIRRHWPGSTLRAEIDVEPGAPAAWVSEAMALMPYAASVERGGLVVRAEAGRAGGGVLALMGRVPDEAALARLAADAGASVAPPFVVRTLLDVGMPRDSVATADSAAALPVVVMASPGHESAAAAIRASLAGGAIGFQPGATGPDPASTTVVDRLAAALAEAPAVRIVIAAPGEGSGSASLDRALARRRAGALAAALVSRGVETARVGVADSEEPPAVVTIEVTLVEH